MWGVWCVRHVCVVWAVCMIFVVYVSVWCMEGLCMCGMMYVCGGVCVNVCVVYVCQWDRVGVGDGGKEEAFFSPGNENVLIH